MTLIFRRQFLKTFLALPAVVLRPGFATTVSQTPLLPPPDQPPFDPARLALWKAARRFPLDHSSDPVASRLLEAAHAGAALDVFYYGGGAPGYVRRIAPLSLFTVEGFADTFVEARCPARHDTRTYNLARLSLEPRRLA